jgi:hypothetical protein
MILYAFSCELLLRYFVMSYENNYVAIKPEVSDSLTVFHWDYQI